MKLERTKNAQKNIAVGMVLKVYQMVMPFLMRSAMIHFMGIQYLGLNSLFTSVLHILNLAELGVGSAMVFSMYKPIVEDDTQTICALMGLYRKYYRIIGLLIGVVGAALTPLIPHLIEKGVPENLNIYVLYLLNLGSTVLTYWLFAYKNCLLSAHQRTDVASTVTMITTTVQYAIQLLVMIVWENYYIHIIVALATQALNNIITAIVTTKMYPQYMPKGKLPKEQTKNINRRIRDLFTGKLGNVILTSADSVVISAFLGVTVLAIYQNYYFIVTSVIGIVEIILQSITAGLGNSYVTETKEKNYKDLQKFTFLFTWLLGVCVCCFLGLYQPFMRLWLRRDYWLLDYGAVICFAVYFFVYCMNRLLNVYKDAAGLWHEDRFRPLLTALVNLGLNLLLINVWGIYGVLLSTVVSMVFVGMPWLLHNIFTMFFPKELLKGYVKQIFKSILITVLAGVVIWLICTPIEFDFNVPTRVNMLLTLMVRICVCLTVPNVLFYFLLRRSEQFRPSVQFLDRLSKDRLKLEARFVPKSNKKTKP